MGAFVIISMIIGCIFGAGRAQTSHGIPGKIIGGALWAGLFGIGAILLGFLAYASGIIS